jgi:peptide/nickel transport system substrate-binding protein
MMRNWFRNPRDVILVPIVLTLALVIACGTAAPEQSAPEQPAAEQPAAQPTAVQQEAPKDSGAAPTAVPAATLAPPEVMESGGTINVGQKELGIFAGHPTLAVNPALFVIQTAPVTEGLLYTDLNREIKGWLAESWSISPDSTTWTFKLHQGVPFHKDYGEMTAEDVVWSFKEGWAQNEKLGRFTDVKLFWHAEGGRVETPDRYTVTVHTGKPLADAGVLNLWMLSPSAGGGTWVASKEQSEKEGVEAANGNPALTGSWEIVEHRSQEFWKMRAVEDHWRKTPDFAELVFWEIPEESSRIAGFQTGQLDTFLMNFDSIPVVEKVEGARLMSIPGSAEAILRLYGNYLVEALDGNNLPAYDPQMAWISSDPGPDSEEWKRAVKVRQALNIAIDRQAIVDTLLRGRGRPLALGYWGNFESQLAGRQWEFNPDKARELLAEAGAEGFSITLTPALRGAPAETEACEAVAAMWTNIGIDVKFQRIPYSVLRPQVVARTYQGATCHTVAGRLMSPGPSAILTTKGTFNAGATHPIMEELSPLIQVTIDSEERVRLETELGRFLFDSAITMTGLYAIDAVWPVGARLEEWTEHVKTKDMRQINGYEFIQHRQK